MAYRNAHRQGRRNPNYRKFGNDTDKEESNNEVTAEVDENRANILTLFKGYQVELDKKYDLTERLVKQSRDVTIESKRIIFLLHRLTRKDKISVLEEANRRLTEIREKNLKSIAEELRGRDSHQFMNSYSPGLEEFIEALSYYHYLKDGFLIPWDKVQEQLTYNKTQINTETGVEELETITLYVSPTIYILGVADLSGELMRKCINDVGAGDVESAFLLRPFMRDMLDGFIRIGNGPREFNNKLRVMYQNVAKVDNACYAIHVRRTEIPDYQLRDLAFVNQSLEAGNQDTSDNFVDNI